MIEAVIWVAAIAGYLGTAMWTAGYMAGKWAHQANQEGYPSRKPSWYYDHPGIWFGGALWPFVFIYAVFCVHMLNFGSRVAMRNAETRKVRIELEKKIRVEQEKLEREAEEEIEAELRKQRAA